MVDRHRVFISFHENDKRYKEYFAAMMDGYIVDKSVRDGDIDDQDVKTETIRQKIRDEFIADATVTVVLVGACTWQRKHVDWEIGASLRNTAKNPRCGLLGILLPSHPCYRKTELNLHLVPPRLSDNCNGNSYARMYTWSTISHTVQEWIHEAFMRKDQVNPINSRTLFGNNRGGECSLGWQS